MRISKDQALEIKNESDLEKKFALLLRACADTEGLPKLSANQKSQIDSEADMGVKIKLLTICLS